ncbi:MAG: xanthine dehydrogenase [Clostridiales bacterium]|nr:xanthine dehydrogenase [Clostridiales bacterium]
MLPFDFCYYLPRSLSQAGSLFEKLQKNSAKPVFFGGGTELISRGRVGNITFGAAIDVKSIHELRQIKDTGKEIVIGGAVCLREIAESNVFPLLGAVVKRIADNTIQNKITLAGNLLGGIIYREAMLPLLLLDAKVVIYEKNSTKAVGIKDLYLKTPLLNEGQLLVEIRVDKQKTCLPWFHNKVVKSEKIDYPLITLCAVKENSCIKYAVSGLYNHPCIIDKESLKNIDINQVLDDHISSASYRVHILKQQIQNAHKELFS